jgi:hypothetical protein
MNRIVSVPMGAADVRPGGTSGYLTHAAEVNDVGDILRVLCRRVKMHHLCHDSSLYDRFPVDCPQCLARRTKAEGTSDT